MNSDIPVEANTRELWAYSTHCRRELQDKGLQAEIHHGALSKDWFALSVWQLDWG